MHPIHYTDNLLDINMIKIGWNDLRSKETSLYGLPQQVKSLSIKWFFKHSKNVQFNRIFTSSQYPIFFTLLSKYSLLARHFHHLLSTHISCQLVLTANLLWSDTFQWFYSQQNSNCVLYLSKSAAFHFLKEKAITLIGDTD